MEDFQLKEFIDVSPRTLDYGRRRLLAITRALAADPVVLLLDEPAAGLDPQQRRELGSLLRMIAKEWGIGVLLVEHDVNMVFNVCDRVVALVGGVAVAEGAPDQVRRNDALLEAYLGRQGEATLHHETGVEDLAAGSGTAPTGSGPGATTMEPKATYDGR